MRVETILMGIEPEGPVEGSPAIAAIAAGARRVEELGFDCATTPETGHDPFLPLAIAAEHTRRIHLGTNVAIAFPRSPMVVAQIAWDLQRFSQGRFELGLGTQVKGHNERRYSTPWPSPPGPRMREYVQTLRAIFKSFQNPAKPEFFTGKHYQFNLITPFFNPGPIEHSHVPVYISSLNTYVAGLAGELCDGVRLHPLVSHKYARDVLRPAIAAGAKKAGRSLSDVDVVGMPFVISGRTQAEIDAAKAPIRQQLSFYASTRTYHSVLEYHGWGAAGIELHRLSLGGKWQEMRDLIDDTMLDEFATIAPYDELAGKLKERWGPVCSTIFLGLPPALWSDEKLIGGIIEDLHKG